MQQTTYLHSLVRQLRRLEAECVEARLQSAGTGRYVQCGCRKRAHKMGMARLYVIR